MATPLASSAHTALRTTDVTPRIGTVVETDVETLLGGTRAGEIRALLEERGVLVFPRIQLSDEQQVAFTRTLGRIVDEGDNYIYKVTLDTSVHETAEYLKGAFYWHIDGTNLEVPIFASLLSGRKLSDTGGDTEFCNTYAAYEDLPESEKQGLEGLTVVHSLVASQRYVDPEPSYEKFKSWRRQTPSRLPLVWTHRSGRKSLVLGCTASHVEGLSVEESDDLLCRLRDWATQPQFVYRHRWTLGDLVIWDNTGTMHRALPYPLDSGRLMHRTKLHGEESFA